MVPWPDGSSRQAESREQRNGLNQKWKDVDRWFQDDYDPEIQLFAKSSQSRISLGWVER